MNSFLGELNQLVQSSPLSALAVLAAAVALATTPIAFAVLGRMQWFEARRGRTMLKPAFASVVASMMLVMGIPAILLGLLVKSQYYDRDRYEHDPNKTLTVLDEGRGLQVDPAEALRSEMKRLAAERKEMLDVTKKLDDAMLALGEAASQSQATAQPMIRAADAMGSLRRVVGHDSSKQWDELITRLEQAPNVVMVAGLPAAAGVAPAGVAPVSAATAAFERELAGVPAPQRALARALTLDDLPAGWETGDLGGKSLETFNAENLYEKIDGRAESFTQFDVTGMAYANFHPAGDTSGEVQLYIFEFGDALKAFGKYGTEKPQGSKPIAVGAEGYTDAGSVSFYQGKNFVQVVSTSDAPKFAEFSAELAHKVAARLAGKPAAGAAPATAAAAGGETTPAVEAAAVSPTDLLKLLPDGPNREEPGYAAQDVFGYSFLSGVFLARYKDGEVTWLGFLRPYADNDAAKAVFEKYIAEAKANEAKVEDVTIEGTDRAVLIADSIGGLLDIIFLKGNSVGGANGANLVNADASVVRQPLERFSKSFAAGLPAKAPVIESSAPAGGGGYDTK